MIRYSESSEYPQKAGGGQKAGMLSVRTEDAVLGTARDEGVLWAAQAH
jgi:hypothetical protein